VSFAFAINLFCTTPHPPGIDTILEPDWLNLVNFSGSSTPSSSVHTDFDNMEVYRVQAPDSPSRHHRMSTLNPKAWKLRSSPLVVVHCRSPPRRSRSPLLAGTHASTRAVAVRNLTDREASTSILNAALNQMEDVK